MKSKNTRNRVLQAISGMSSVSASSLAATLGVPAPSVRRSIRELRRAGIDIRTDYYGYRAMNVQPTTQASL